MDESKDSASWLIRDNSNRIRGPFRESEIVQMIKKGQLKGKTEVSRANSYWFAIEEKTELGRFLPEFNGGKPPPEQPTQMTATLTEADVQDHGVEITTFTVVPKEIKDAQKAAAKEGGPEQIEWLSDEFAEEFGDFGMTLSVQIEPSALNEVEKEEELASKTKQPEAPSMDEQAKQEMLRRATVKADTLPSEHKSFHGERPKPIDTLMRSPGKPGASAISSGAHAMVSVAVEPDLTPKMFMEEDEGKQKERRDKRNKFFSAALAAVLVLGVTGYVLVARKYVKAGPSRRVRNGEEATVAARQSVILFDLEGAKSALADLELEPSTRGEATTYLAQAVVKKEFLYDVEGAMLALQAARSQVRNKRAESEVDNLMAVYGFERDAASSAEILRRNLEGNKDDAVFRYNLALSLLRTGKQQEAVPILSALLSSVSDDNSLMEDAALAEGWALDSFCGGASKDPLCKRSADAEDAYLRALAINPNSAKARLGLALFRLRRMGIKAAEPDFRAFLDSAPDLDPPTRVMNFRKLSDHDFYTFAHAQIVDLNTPNQNMSKPSPLIMAADAVISVMGNRNSEAGKILEGALTSAPGDVNVLKALGYLRWKDGKLDEVVEALKDSRDRSSFAVNLMLGKAYLKLRKRDLAEKHFHALVEAFPNRSEGHSLLGELLLDQPDKTEDAMNEFRLALKKDSLDLIAWRGLQRAGSPLVLTPELQKNLPF